MTPRRTGFLSTGDRVVGERSRVPALLGLGNAGNTPLTAPPDCSPRSQEQSGTLGTVQVDRSRSSGTVRRQRSLRLFPKIGNSRTAETITSRSIPSTTRGRPWRPDTTREPAPSPWTVGDLAGNRPPRCCSPVVLMAGTPRAGMMGCDRGRFTSSVESAPIAPRSHQSHQSSAAISLASTAARTEHSWATTATTGQAHDTPPAIPCFER
jgi:hypothetical protein